MRPNELTHIPYGFAWGNVVVERVVHDERIGWVIRVWARKDSGELGEYVDVRVTPAGTKAVV